MSVEPPCGFLKSEKKTLKALPGLKLKKTMSGYKVHSYIRPTTFVS